jgi:paraquat-inducible protein A
MHLVEQTSEGGEAPEAALHPRFACRYCGYAHHAVTLKPYQKASCVQCGSVLAKGTRFGSATTAALVVTALILAGPALYLPFITVGKLGSERTGHLLSGAQALWTEDMRLLSVWVTLCAGIAPILMLIALAALILPSHFGRVGPWPNSLKRTAVALEEWAMPEVYVLGVLVALTKLGSLVDVKIGPGFWCYAATSALLLLSWRNFRLGPGSSLT